MNRHRKFRGLPFLLLALLVLPFAPAHAIEIKRVVSPGGIEAWLVEDMKIPVIAIDWSFEGAGIVPPKGKEGLANLAASTMDEGAGDLDSQAFQAKLADIGARLRFSDGRENFSGSLVTLRDQRAEALGLAKLALNQPRFDADAVERIRAAIIAELRRDAGDPNTIARQALNATLFPGHPYAVDSRGTPESVAAITPDDLRTFAKTQLGRDRLLVAVAGAISAEELGAALDDLFGGLPAKTTVPPMPDAKMTGLGTTKVVDLPSAQTIVLMTGPGIPRSDPDWYAARIATRIVGGGGFSSRLMTEVREKRGLTYGFYAGLIPLDKAPMVYASGSTANANAGALLKVVRDVWREVGEKGVTAEELEEAKTFITGSLPLQFDSTAATAGIVLQIRRDHLPIDLLDKRDAMINAITLADVNRVAHRLFDPDKLLTVLVGRPEGLSKGVGE